MRPEDLLEGARHLAVLRDNLIGASKMEPSFHEFLARQAVVAAY